MSARYSAADYVGALRSLLPRGRVWSAEPGSVRAQVLGVLAPAAERVDAAACDLMVAAFPTTATALIEEWEETLGLPDPCLGPDPTPAQRRDQIRARLTAGGGQSISRYIAFAAALGFVVTVREYAPFRANRGRVGSPIVGEAWAHAWRMTIVSGEIGADHALFRAGQNRADDRLASIATAITALACELRSIAPAHTILLLDY